MKIDICSFSAAREAAPACCSPVASVPGWLGDSVSVGPVNAVTWLVDGDALPSAPPPTPVVRRPSAVLGGTSCMPGSDMISREWLLQPVCTARYTPLGERVCSREDVTNGLNIFRFFFSNPFVTFFAEIISKYQRSKFYMYLAQRCSSFLAVKVN